MGLGDRPLLTLRLPFRLTSGASGRKGEAMPDAASGSVEAAAIGSPVLTPTHGVMVATPDRDAPADTSAGAAAASRTRPGPAAEGPLVPPPAHPPAGAGVPLDPRRDDATDASATLVWLAYTSTLAARASTLEEAALAALEGRLDPMPRRRAARDTLKLATSLWLVEARDAARQAWEAAAILDAGTMLGTANALRLSQIVEGLHSALRNLPPPEALSTGGRAQTPLLLVVDDDDVLVRELPIEAAVRGWRARVVRNLNAPVDERPDVIVLGPDTLGDVDAAARRRLLAAFPGVPLATLVASGALADRSTAHSVEAARTLCKPVTAAALVDDAADLLRRHQTGRPAVLVGVDDEALRATVHRLLGKTCALADVHESAEALWTVATQTRPELCVLDERCAGGAALHIVRALRREADVAHVGVVLLSTAADAETLARAAEAGVDDCVPAEHVETLLAPMAQGRLARGRTQRLAQDLDPATRVPRLHAVMPMLERMVSIARRYHHPLAVFSLEVDGLRAIAQQHDDSTADRLAALLGRRLSRAFRNEDLVAHVSTGRFVVAGFGMKSDDGVQRLAELLEGYREQGVEAADRTPVRTSFSAGVAQIRLDGPDAATLLRAADQALDSARRHGGNRVEVASRAEGARVDWTADALIVDGDAPFAALVEHALETRGHRVRTIGDGREALEALTHAESPVRARLIVLELGLPGLDGLSLLRQLGEAGVLRSSRAVVVTTRSVEAEMIKAMELGAVDYITKPVSLPVLMRRLRSALAGAAGVA